MTPVSPTNTARKAYFPASGAFLGSNTEHLNLRLSLAFGPVYEAGAAMLSALAWPELLADTQAIAERHAALCQYGVRLLAAADEEWTRSPQPIKPIYLSVAEHQVQRVRHELFRRLAQRLAAARMVIPFLQEASGVPARLPRGMSRLSLNSLAEVAANDLNLSDAGNVGTRVWRPSRPVIHIAAAIEVASEMEAREGRTFSVLDVMLREEVIRWVVDTSNSYLQLLSQNVGFRFRIPVEDSVRLSIAQ